MFEIFNLKDDSFPMTPDDQHETSWFGFKSLKREFDTMFQRSGSEQLRLCVLNRGRLGAGKTHAAHYFAEKLSSRRNIGMYQRFIPLVIESPKQPQKAFVDFATRLQNSITFRRLAQISTDLRELLGETELFNRLLAATGSEDVASVLSTMSEENLLTRKAFLLGVGTAKDLREIGVAKRLTVDHEFALAVIGVLQLLIQAPSRGSEALNRVVLWVDEMEDLVFFQTRYYLPFTQALREVIDNTNLHLTLMLNFTFAEPEDLPAIENVLGQAIMQRVNHHIVFQDPTSDDLKTYLLELLEANRLEKKGSATFPFARDAFDLLIESSVSRTPRFLNTLCDMLLRDVQQEWGNRSRPNREISRELLAEKLPGLMALIEESRR